MMQRMFGGGGGGGGNQRGNNNGRNSGQNNAQQGRGQQPAPRGSEISYSDAVTQLQSMFSTVDMEVIRLVLDSNGGRMETTVEQLLQMTGSPAPPVDNNAPPPSSSAPQDQVYRPPTVPPPASELPRQKSNRVDTGPQKGRASLGRDFLQPPSYYGMSLMESDNSGPTDDVGRAEQMQSDEEFARMLQDSLLMAELSKHPEWIKDAQRAEAASKAAAKNKAKNAGPNFPRNDGPNFPVQGGVGSINNPNSAASYTRNINQSGNSSSGYERFKAAWGRMGNAARQKISNISSKMSNKSEEPNYSYANLNSIDDEPKRKKDGFGSSFAWNQKGSGGGNKYKPVNPNESSPEVDKGSYEPPAPSQQL